jgi:FlaA1/EpsC-like NDP-sugar epimerase
MTSLRRQILLKTFKASDVLIMACSFVLATWAAFYRIETISFNEFLAMRVKVQNLALFLGFLLVWHIIFSLFRLYHSRRLSTQRGEIIDVLKATSIGTAGIFITAIFFRIDIVTPTFLAVFWVAGTAITIVCRLTLRHTMAWIRVRGRNLRHMLIVGTNPRGIRFARKIESKPELGYCLVGFVDNGRSRNQEFQESGYKVVSDLDGFSSFIGENVVDEVMICLPVKSFYDRISMIAKLCEEQGIIVRHLSDMFDLKLSRSKTEYFEGTPLISHYTGAMGGWQLTG